MLIVYKFNFELSIIGVILILRRDEEFQNVIFGEQGTAQNSHDLNDWTTKLEVVLNDSDETVCDDGNMNLNAHCIVALTLERLDLEVLLDPFEKEFDLYGWRLLSACHPIVYSMPCHPSFHFSVNHGCGNNGKCSTSFS